MSHGNDDFDRFHIREHMTGIDVRQEALKLLTTGGVLSDRFSHGVSSTEG